MLVWVPCYLMIFCCMFRSLIVLCIFVMARVGGFCVVCWFVVWLSLFCVLFTVLVMFGIWFWCLGFGL